MRRLRLLAHLAFSALLVIPAALVAQSPADSTPRLDTIVVTANREATNLATVPFAVSVVNKDRWKNRAGYGLDHALSEVPGVLVQSRFGTHDVRLTIRGFGARGAGDRSNAGTSRGIRILLDGIPETEPDGRTAFDHVDLATIERVEVLRSNGSATWGNAAGGIVAMSTMPEFTNSFSEFTQQAGSSGLVRSIGRIGTNLGNAKSWLSVTRTEFDGWRDHSNAFRSQMVGGVIAPTSRGGRIGLQLAAADNKFRIPGPLTPAQFDSAPQQPNPTYNSRDEHRFNRLMRLGVTLEQPIGDSKDFTAMLYVNPKYLQRSERNTFRDFTRYHVGAQSSWGARGEAFGVGHRVRVGGDLAYQDGAILFYNLGPGNTRGTTLQQNKGEAAQNTGLFVQDEVSVNDKLTVLVGARYDDLSYFYRDFIDPSINASKRFNQVSPRAGVSYRPSDATTFFASFGRGVEIPAGNETDPPASGIPDPTTALNPLLDVVRSRTMEAGVRRHMALRNPILQGASIDATIYDVRVDGEPVPYNGGRFYLTAGEVQRRGLELALTGAFASGFTARLSGTFSDNTYIKYVIDSTYLGAPGGTAVRDGNDVAGLPTRVINASVQWQPFAIRGFVVEFGAQHNNDYFADDANVVNVPGFTVFRANASLERDIAGVSARFSAAVENLTDEKYVGSAFINPDYTGGAPLVYEAGLPRGVMLSVSLRRAR